MRYVSLTLALALALVGPGTICDRAIAQQEEPASSVALKKPSGKERKKSGWLFSPQPSVVAKTEQALDLAKSLEGIVGQNLSKKSLSKLQVPKHGAPKGFTTATSKFAVNVPEASGRNAAQGRVTTSRGETFVAFIRTGKKLLAVIEARKRAVGASSQDVEREAQVAALGFRVNALVEKYQLAVWENIDPKGIAATVSKKPDLVTTALRPEKTAKLLIPNGIVLKPQEGIFKATFFPVDAALNVIGAAGQKAPEPAEDPEDGDRTDPSQGPVIPIASPYPSPGLECFTVSKEAAAPEFSGILANGCKPAGARDSDYDQLIQPLRNITFGTEQFKSFFAGIAVSISECAPAENLEQAKKVAEATADKLLKDKLRAALSKMCVEQFCAAIFSSSGVPCNQEDTARLIEPTDAAVTHAFGLFFPKPPPN